MYVVALLVGLSAPALGQGVHPAAQGAAPACAAHVLHVSTGGPVGACPQFLATTRIARQRLDPRT